MTFFFNYMIMKSISFEGKKVCGQIK